jgi:spermidine/putrescine transport system substrate-binding protein
MMDPKNAAEASNFTGYNNGITGSEQYLKEDLRNDAAFNTPADMAKRFKPTRECPKTALDLREKIWTRLLR